jgi:hypothetical protein
MSLIDEIQRGNVGAAITLMNSGTLMKKKMMECHLEAVVADFSASRFYGH